MNFIAGVLLLHLDEENAFWLMVQMMKKYSIEKFYMRESQWMTECIERFDRWLKELLPDLHSHLKRENIAAEIFFSQWLRTVFTYGFPLGIVFRIWDIFFVGSE